MAWHALPESVLPAKRKERDHISSVLSRNEVDRDYAYNRKRFMRVANGRYPFNPGLEVRYRIASGEETWKPIFLALNLPFINESTFYTTRLLLGALLATAGLPACPEPLMTQRKTARRLAELKGLPPPPVRTPAPFGSELMRMDAVNGVRLQLAAESAAEQQL